MAGSEDNLLRHYPPLLKDRIRVVGAQLVQTLVCWLGVALPGEPTVRSPLGALLPWLEIHKESACTSFLRRVHGRCSELESLFPAILSWKTGSTSLIPVSRDLPYFSAFLISRPANSPNVCHLSLELCDLTSPPLGSISTSVFSLCM